MSQNPPPGAKPSVLPTRGAMREPDRLDNAGRQLSPEERRRVVRAAFLRPTNLLVVVIGTVFFALALVWWAIPLTLATCFSGRQSLRDARRRCPQPPVEAGMSLPSGEPAGCRAARPARR